MVFKTLNQKGLFIPLNQDVGLAKIASVNNLFVQNRGLHDLNSRECEGD